MQSYLTSIRKRFRACKDQGDRTFDQLTDADWHRRPNEASNSIAVIIQHLHGNMLSRWTNFLTEDGEKESRDRDAEFEEQALSRDELLQRWNEGWDVLFSAIDALKEEDLQRTVTIRLQPLEVVDALNRQLAHYSAHVGQIVYLGRWFRDAEWKTLSIPKGGSAAFNKKMRESKS